MTTPSTMTSQTTLASRPKLKGILKQSTVYPSTPPGEEAAAATETAELTRAEILARSEKAARVRLLQKLRDTQLKPPVPFSTFETLCELPRSSTHPASAPSAADADTFLTLLTDFQPSEYMDLIEERNCLGKCGYTLCGRPRRALEGSFRIARGIARTEDLNKWCSDACARRGLYLKVQLENPSYVRDERPGGGGMVVKLELREEDGGAGDKGKGLAGQPGARKLAPRGKEEDRLQLAEIMAKLELSRRMSDPKEDAALLGGERGDAIKGFFVGVTRVEVNMNDTPVIEPVQPPSSDLKGTEYMIEGYMPKIFRGRDTGSATTPAVGKNSEAAKKAADGANGAESEDDADDDDDDDFFTVRF
ncbi:Rtr1/RPAP2 family-domain-containing protein [Chaetomium tenue]|uniref:Rtr1/RPAP2 family-domain-containing protein n=1 Tax=Chaetomium tenue TaxID=1854479 RepID=A0ACB7PAX2_9PEZI|nr:Rtr1/RPAP2 family-domain-containing protein [Chaetomium globosum]